ncbi:hypothetical protein WNJ68_20615 [Klebsiella grimontii]|uniref:hypothetical protein n=1 Tax=Klebsiella grimontii TaxID=2058152 RepID=UPI00310133E7
MANLESAAVAAGRRLTNWGKAGGAFTLSGDATLADKGVTSAGTSDSRLTLSTAVTDAWSLVALCDVAEDSSILRIRDIRLHTNADKKLVRVMTAGQSLSGIQAPAEGAFVVFVQGDATGHRFGMIANDAIQSVTSSAPNTGATSTFIGGLNIENLPKPWTGYGAMMYPRKLTDTELLLVAGRLIVRADALGVTVNG